MGTQVETVMTHKVLAKRTTKAGVGPCVEFFFSLAGYRDFAHVRVQEEGTGREMTLHGWWREQVREGVHTTAVFSCGTVREVYP